MKVYCDVKSCPWYRDLSEPYQVNRGKGQGWDWDKVPGECTRDEIVVRGSTYGSRDTLYKLPLCTMCGDKLFSGHLDLSRFPKKIPLDNESSAELAKETKQRKAGEKTVF